MKVDGAPWKKGARDGVLLFLVLCAAGFIVGQSLQTWWLWRFDSELAVRAQELGKHVHRNADGGWTPDTLSNSNSSVSQDHRQQTYWQISDSAGNVLGASAALREFRFPALQLASLPRHEWYHCYYLHKMRVASMLLPTVARLGVPVVLHFAQDYRSYRERIEALNFWLGQWIAFAFLLSVGRAGWSIRVRTRREKRAPPVPSLLVRLLFGLFLAVTVALVPAGYATYELVEDGWIRQMDQALENRARGVAALCDRLEGKWRLDATHLDTSIFREAKSMQYFEVWDDRGAVVGRSASLAHLDLPWPTPTGGKVLYGWFHPTYLHRTRTVSLDVVREGERLTISFGQDYRGMKAKLRELKGILLWLWGGTVLLLGILMALLVHVALKPLHVVARRLHALDAGHWGEFRSDKAPSEIRPLVDALGQALGRLESAFRRERSLLANLAHELRTPLAGMRTTLEVGVTDDERHARQAMSDSIRLTLQMQEVIDSLLLLGRLEAGKMSSRMETVAMDSLRERLSEGLLDVDMELESGLCMHADFEWMVLVLRNLLDNAKRHAGPDGWIRMEACQCDGEVRVVLANSGCDLRSDEVERVFERFWRKDRVRSIDSRNSGLGLALCRELVESMAGEISAGVPETGVFAVEIRLKSGNSSDFTFPSSSQDPGATREK